MKEVHLGYGDRSLKLDSDDRFSIVSIDASSERPLSDIEVGAKLDSPISSAPLDELILSNDSVLIVVSDATRATASAQIVNLLVRRLIQSGVAANQVAIIFATGIHRAVTQQEKLDLITPFIAQRVRTLTHNAHDHDSMISLGLTQDGIPIEVNKALTEFSKIVVLGGINFHYFAGFTGGRKSICPGLASAKTIETTHMLALDFEHGGRRLGVGTGLLDGNAVHEACEFIAGLVQPTFGINTIVDQLNRSVSIHCGDWRLAHQVACQSYLNNHSVEIEAKRELVIVSCGGFPHDINLIQAHKALDMASHACKEGGSIILLAECRDGFGRPDFLKWFDCANSSALAKRLVDHYEVNGQTAWALMSKAERFRVQLISNLPEEAVRKIGIEPASNLEDALRTVAGFNTGFILPRGAGVLPKVGTNGGPGLWNSN